MSQHISFLLLGLGAGAIYAALALSVVVTYRSTAVINFAYGAMALYPATVFYQLRADGRLIMPIGTVRLSTTPTPVAPALGLAFLTSLLLGLVCHFAVFRWLRNAPALAKVAASIGLWTALVGLTTIRFPHPPGAVSPLPSATVDLLGSRISENRLILAGLVVLVGLVLTMVYRFTRFGLAQRAAAESGIDATLLGYSTQRLALTSWLIGATLAGMFGVLIAPITSLEPSAFANLLMAALAASLLARLSSFGIAITAGLGLGALQTEILHLTATQKWIPSIGTGDLTVFAAMSITMLAMAGRLPTRGASTQGRLPAAILTRRPLLYGASASVIGVILLVVVTGPYRSSLTTSFIAILVALSLVVITGFVGQISLAQLTFAGISAFTVAHLAADQQMPFVATVPIGVLVSTAVGSLIGLLALRVRGVNLAILTGAFAVAVSSFIFQNPKYAGGNLGLPVPVASIFGWRLGSSSNLEFGLVCLGLVIACCAAVTALRRSELGLRMLAVRVNERAAGASGVNVMRTKLLAFCFSSALAGLAGCLTAYGQNSVDFTPWGVLLSVLILAGAYISGIASVGGAVLAGMLAFNGLVLYWLNRHIHFGSYQSLISGALLVLVSVRNPEGVVGAASLHWRNMAQRRSEAARARPSGSIREAAHAPSVGERTT